MKFWWRRGEWICRSWMLVAMWKAGMEEDANVAKKKQLSKDLVKNIMNLNMMRMGRMRWT